MAKPVSFMRKFAVVVSLITVVAVILAYRLYNKPHRAVTNEVAVQVTAVNLFDAFATDELEANRLYLDKVLSVTGMVSEVLTNQDGSAVLVLKTNDPLFGVSCTMQDYIGGVRTGMAVTIKGICTGYLSDVVITNGIVVE